MDKPQLKLNGRVWIETANGKVLGHGRIEEPMVISHRGGKGGGKAEVTEKGLKAIAQFHALQQQLNEFLITHVSDLDL
jgi:molybdate transport system regulatory protein